jgi:hypothetical protein
MGVVRPVDSTGGNVVTPGALCPCQYATFPLAARPSRLRWRPRSRPTPHSRKPGTPCAALPADDQLACSQCRQMRGARPRSPRKHGRSGAPWPPHTLLPAGARARGLVRRCSHREGRTPTGHRPPGRTRRRLDHHRDRLPQRLLVTLPRRPLPPVTAPTRRVVTYLGDRHDMQRVVQLPIPRPRQPMPDHVPGGNRDRRSARIRRERRRRGKPAHRPNPSQDLDKVLPLPWPIFACSSP